MVQKRSIGFWATALLLGTLAVPAIAQPQPGQPAQPGQPGAGGGGGRAGFQQRMNDQLKQQLGVTDEEFTALQPKIEAVTTAQRATRGGGMFGGGGGRRGQNGGGAAGTPPADATPTQAASAELKTTLDNKEAKPEEIKAKLAALRDARAKAKEALVKAQTELQGLLTQRQEAVLVNMGILD
jgi:hypothetical protein